MNNEHIVTDFYNTLAMLAYLMDISCIHHHWKQRLLDLLKQYSIDAKAIGAPAGFELLPIWHINHIGIKHE